MVKIQGMKSWISVGSVENVNEAEKYGRMVMSDIMQ